MQTIEEIMEIHRTDKGSFHHNYCRQYQDTFSKYRNMTDNYLEIGVFNGDSLKAFREVFKNARCIVGIDIDPNCKKYEDQEKGIYVEIGDATDENFLKRVVEKYGGFSVILDDGSHFNFHVIRTFEILFPLLNDGGKYVAEDTNVYNFQGYYNPNYPNHIQYFANMTLFVNQSRANSTVGIRDPCADPFKIFKKTTNKLEQGIDKISFGCGFIEIDKLVRSHWI